MSEKIYYFTFAYSVFSSDQADRPDSEKDRLIAVTDLILEGDSQETVQKAIDEISANANKKGFVVCLNPPPVYVKKTKRAILEFIEKGKKEITSQRNEKRKRKNAAQKTG